MISRGGRGGAAEKKERSPVLTSQLLSPAIIAPWEWGGSPPNLAGHRNYAPPVYDVARSEAILSGDGLTRRLITRQAFAGKNKSNRTRTALSVIGTRLRRSDNEAEDTTAGHARNVAKRRYGST